MDTACRLACIGTCILKGWGRPILTPPPASAPPSICAARQDLEIPADVAAEVAAAAAAGPGEGAQFVAPTPGVSAVNRWQTKCHLAAEQVAAGAFDTAMRLLTRWVLVEGVMV